MNISFDRTDAIPTPHPRRHGPKSQGVRRSLQPQRAASVAHREHREWFVDCTRLLGDISLYATNLAGATGVQSSTPTPITMRTA